MVEEEMDRFKIAKADKKISRGVYSTNREEACDTNLYLKNI